MVACDVRHHSTITIFSLLLPSSLLHMRYGHQPARNTQSYAHSHFIRLSIDFCVYSPAIAYQSDEDMPIDARVHFICSTRRAPARDEEKKNEKQLRRGSSSRRRRRHLRGEWRRTSQWVSVCNTSSNTNTMHGASSIPMKNRKKHKIGISFASNTLFSVVFNILDAFVRQTKFFNFFRQTRRKGERRNRNTVFVRAFQRPACTWCERMSCTCSHFSHDIAFYSPMFRFNLSPLCCSTYERRTCVCVYPFCVLIAIVVAEGRRYIHFLCLHLLSIQHQILFTS